jgi:hypothetical protein
MSRKSCSKITTLVQATGADEVEEVDEGTVDVGDEEEDEDGAGQAAFCRRPSFHGR